MKKNILGLLTYGFLVCLVFFLVSCSEINGVRDSLPKYINFNELPENYTLEDAKTDGCVVFEDLSLRFTIITGIDSDDCFELLYHFANDQTGTFVTVKAFIRDRETPAVESITPLIPGAEWIERELHDILGIDFKNHPNLRRLILSDDWPEGVYPLRKEAKK